MNYSYRRNSITGGTDQNERIIIRAGNAKSWARSIFKKLKENASQTYEMQAYGHENVQMCQEVRHRLNRWIETISLESGYTERDSEEV